MLTACGNEARSGAGGTRCGDAVLKPYQDQGNASPCRHAILQSATCLLQRRVGAGQTRRGKLLELHARVMGGGCYWQAVLKPDQVQGEKMTRLLQGRVGAGQNRRGQLLKLLARHGGAEVDVVHEALHI